MNLTTWHSSSSLSHLEPVQSPMIKAESCSLKTLQDWLRASHFKGSYTVALFPETPASEDGTREKQPAFFRVWSGSHPVFVPAEDKCRTLKSRLLRVEKRLEKALNHALLYPLRPLEKHLHIKEWEKQQQELGDALAKAREMIAPMGTFNGKELDMEGTPLTVKKVLGLIPKQNDNESR